MSDSAIELDHVRRVYPDSKGADDRVALDDVSLSIKKGAWISLLGPNGSGKSTLLRLLATMDEPTTGALRWFGDANANRRDIRATLGVVFQSPSLDVLLSIRENLRLQSAIFGLPEAESNARIERLADELRLTDRLDDRVGALSGGLARRADLARALLTNPSLLLLDEATAGLDPPSRDEFLAALSRRHGAGDLTILMTTHLMDEAERAGRVVMMDGGRVVADGSPDDLRRGLTHDGRIVLRTGWASHDELAALGYSPTRAGESALLPFTHEDHEFGEALDALIASGASVSIGPPTLEDVFAAKTGHTLDRAVESL